MSKENKNDTPACGTPQGAATGDAADREALRANMARIKHKIVVLSGKGGVGKSTVAVNLAAALSDAKFKTGLLDIDIHGPSVPKLLGMELARVAGTEDGGILPVRYSDTLSVISIGFLMQNADEAVIWRGPMKYGVIKQFLKDVRWGDLDYLVIDSPPGTGDEPLSVCQFIDNPDGAVIVTTPQDVALADVRRSVKFCRELGMPVLGVVENMSGFVCPHCGKPTEIFKSGGGRAMAESMGIPFLGNIPLDPQIVIGADGGSPFAIDGPRGEGEARKGFMRVVDGILGAVQK